MLLQHLAIAVVALPLLVAIAAMFRLTPDAAGARAAGVTWWALASLVGLALALSLWIAFTRPAVLAQSFALLEVGQQADPLSPRAAGLLVIAGRIGALVLAATLAHLVARRRGVEAIVLRAASDIALFRGQIASDVQRWRDETNRTHRILLAALVTLAVATWLPLLLEPMGADEAITYVFFAARTPLDIVSDYSMPNNHVLHTLAAHFSTAIFGSSDVALRIPAFLGGLALIPLVYWLTWRLFDPASALIAAAIVSAAPAVAEYATQARGYTLVSLYTLCAFVILTYTKERSSWTGWIVYAVCVALSCYVVPTALFGLFMIAAWVLLETSRASGAWTKTFVLASLAAGGLVFVLYLPIILRSGLASLIENEYVRAHSIGALFSGLKTTARLSVACWTGPWPQIGGPLFGVAAFTGIWTDPPPRRSARKLGLAVLLGFIAVVILMRAAPPPRVLQVAFLLLVPITAYGMRRLLSAASSNRSLVPEIAALALAAFWSAGALARTQWRAFNVPAAAASDPGTKGVRCCAEGYYPDAPAVAAWAAQETTVDERMFTPPQSGWVQSTRFYLMREGRRAAQLREFSEASQLTKFPMQRRILLLAPPPGADESADARAASSLGISKSELVARYDSITLLQRFRLSSVYALYPRPALPGASLTVSDTGRALLLPRTERRARRSASE